MKLKTFIAANMQTAMQKIRQELGEDAVIISSNKEQNGQIRVTAALDRDDNFEAITHKTNLPKFHNQLAQIFHFHKIPSEIATKMLSTLGFTEPASISEALENILYLNFKFQPLKFSLNKPLMLIGMPGIGKTLAISKMATEASFHNKNVAVITTDIKRAGGVEQLTAFTKILGLELAVCRNPPELKLKIENQKSKIILIDTAGANPYDKSELESTEDLIKSIKVEPMLAVQAGGDVEEATEMAKSFQFAPCERLLITKADSARRLGSLFAVAHANNLAFSNFSGTPNVGKGLEPVTPKSLAALLLKPIL